MESFHLHAITRLRPSAQDGDIPRDRHDCLKVHRNMLEGGGRYEARTQNTQKVVLLIMRVAEFDGYEGAEEVTDRIYLCITRGQADMRWKAREAKGKPSKPSTRGVFVHFLFAAELAHQPCRTTTRTMAFSSAKWEAVARTAGG